MEKKKRKEKRKKKMRMKQRKKRMRKKMKGWSEDGKPTKNESAKKEWGLLTTITITTTTATTTRRIDIVCPKHHRCSRWR